MKKRIYKILKIRETNDFRSVIILLNYRISNYIYVRVRLKLIKKILIFILKILNVCCRLFFSIDLPYECTIGENILLGHGGRGIVIHPEVKIGKNATIYHNVTIGGTAISHYIKADGNKGIPNKKAGVPTIGDGVLIGAGAVIIGDIIIGSNVKIGANVVVTKNVPSNSTVVSQNIRIISNI